MMRPMRRVGLSLLILMASGASAQTYYRQKYFRPARPTTTTTNTGPAEKATVVNEATKPATTVKEQAQQVKQEQVQEIRPTNLKDVSVVKREPPPVDDRTKADVVALTALEAEEPQLTTTATMTVNPCAGTSENCDEMYYNNLYEIFNPRILPDSEEEMSVDDVDDDKSDVVEYKEIVIEYEGYEAPHEFRAEIYDDEKEDGSSREEKRDITGEMKVGSIEVFEMQDGLLHPTKPKIEELRPATRIDASSPQLRTKDELGVIATSTRKIFRIKFLVPIIWFPCWHRWIIFHIKMPSASRWMTWPQLLWPRRCRKCYSYAGILMADHGKTIYNCGGRRCSCWDGLLTCQAKCKQRKAYHTTSSTEKQKLVNAMNWVNSQEGTTLGNHLGTTNDRSYYSVLQDHLTYSSPWAHGGSSFLPWHRCYLCEYEQLLQLYDVCVTIPFWYHPKDSNLSPGGTYHILDDNWLGDEVASYGQLNNPFNVPPGFVSFHRGNNNNNGNLATTLDVANLLNMPNYNAFRSASEGWLHHGKPHVEIGGNMGTFQSPADVFFWLHHNNIDRTWELWRKKSSANAADYLGSTSANVSPQWNVPISDVIDKTGLFAASVTRYRKNVLPTGDHCAVCYRRIWTIIKDIAVAHDLQHERMKLTFDSQPLEVVLAEKFASNPKALQVRTKDDHNVQMMREANRVVLGQASDEQIALIAKDKCEALNLPDDVKRFQNQFGMNELDLKREMCDIMQRRVVDADDETNTVRLVVPNRDVDDNSCGDDNDEDDGQQKEDEAQALELLISPDMIAKKLGPCPTDVVMF